MVLSKRTSAHVSTVFEIDMTRIDQLRQKHKAAFEERGVRLTYTPFILKAVVDALKAFPVLNASIDGDNDRLPQGRQPRRSRWPSTGASSCRSSTTPTRRTCSASPGP